MHWFLIAGERPATIMAWPYLAVFTTIRSRDRCSWIYLCFHDPYKNQIWQYGSQYAMSLQVTVTLPQLGRIKNINDFIFSSISSITTNVGRMKDQYALTLQVILLSVPLAHVNNTNGFISTFINPMTTKLDKMLDQHALS